MNEEMMEGQVPPEAEVPVDPMDNLMAVLAELQERYGIEQAEMDAVVDAINAAFGAEDTVAEDEGAEDAAAAAQAVADETGAPIV